MAPSTSTAEQPSVVEHFSIEGLYGYRSIGLDSKYAATVLIAGNGSGKTTLLGALDAFIRGQFSRLSTLQFERINCKLRGVEEALTVTRNDIDQISQIPVESELWQAAKAFELEPLTLVEFLENDFQNSDPSEFYEHHIFQQILAKTGFSTPNARSRCEKLAALLGGRNSNVDHIKKILAQVLTDIEVVYLPTYRRIELSLPESGDVRRGRRRQSIQAKLGIPRRGLYAGDIQFGLADISERLATLNQQMLYQSNQGYEEISANILNDLINGSYERGNPSPEERPTKEALKLFFSRILEGGDAPYRYGPHRLGYLQIPDVERIYAEENISVESRKLLTYFLGKLNSVLQKTKDVEGVVEEFIRHCNQYLSGGDGSASLEQHALESGQSLDDKKLTFNRRNLKVSVSSAVTGKKIPLDALSSGEKQMISLLARLYLYPPKRKLLLIDEPELSLSIEWQRKILSDVVNAPLCAQVIAITHSPFVFDNELEPFATSVTLRIDRDPTRASISDGEVET